MQETNQDKGKTILEKSKLAQLTTLWQTVSEVSVTASQVLEIAQKSHTYHFNVQPDFPLTFYLQTEKAEVRIFRWDKPQIELTIKLQMPFGWRVATEQDAAGVYVAARRKPVVGRMSTGIFEAVVPMQTYLVLKCADSGVYLGGVDGTLHISNDRN